MDHLLHGLGASASTLGRQTVHRVRENVLPRLERELRDNIVPKLERKGEEWKERWQEQQQQQKQRKRRRRPRPPSNTDLVYLTDRFLVSSKPAAGSSNGGAPTFSDEGRDASARERTKQAEKKNGREADNDNCNDKQAIQEKQNHQRRSPKRPGVGRNPALENKASDESGDELSTELLNISQSHSEYSISEVIEVDEEDRSAESEKGRDVLAVSENPQDGGAEVPAADSAPEGEVGIKIKPRDDGGDIANESHDEEDIFSDAVQSTDISYADGNSSFYDDSIATPMEQQQQPQQEQPPTPLTKNVSTATHALKDLEESAGIEKRLSVPPLTSFPPLSMAQEADKPLPAPVSPGAKSPVKVDDASYHTFDDESFHSTHEEKDEIQSQSISSPPRPALSSSPTKAPATMINSPGNMVTYLDKAHGRDHYLAVSLAKEKPDDRTLLLFRRQIVPMGIDGSSGNPNSRWSPCCVERSETPSIPHVLKICYAIHAFLALDPSNVVLTYCDNGKTRTAIAAACYLRFANMVERTEDGFRHFLVTLRKQRKLLLEREKERRRMMGPILAAAMDAVMDDYDDGDYGDNGVGESPEEIGRHQAIVDSIIEQIPPSLKLFFRQFDRVLQLGGFLNRKPLLLRAITLQGIPVEEQPCVDVWDSSQRHVYSSHYPISAGTSALANANHSKPVSQWIDEEGFYRINVVLDGEFLVLCRFGGDPARLSSERRVHDPSKILFRYTNTTGFMSGGCLYELPPQKVDLTRQYADHLDDEDFLVTLILEADWERTEEGEGTGDTALPAGSRERLRSASEVCSKRIWRSHEEEARDEGWKVVFENHSARPSTVDVASFRNFCGDSPGVDYCPDHLVVLALQLTNFDFHRTAALLWKSPVFSWWQDDTTSSEARSSSDNERDTDMNDKDEEEKCDRKVEIDATINFGDGSKKTYQEIEDKATQSVLDILDSIDVSSNLDLTDQKYLQTFREEQSREESCPVSSRMSSQEHRDLNGGCQQSLSGLCVKETGYLVPSILYPYRGDISRSFQLHGKSEREENPGSPLSILQSQAELKVSNPKPRLPYFSSDKPKLLPPPSDHIRDRDRLNDVVRDRKVPTYDLGLEAAREIHSKIRHTGVTVDMLVELERVSKQWGSTVTADEPDLPPDPDPIENAEMKDSEELRGDSTMNREEKKRKEKEWQDAQKAEAEEKLKKSKEKRMSREKEKAAEQEAERKRIEEDESAKEVPLRDDPEYGKYFKMLGAGLAREQVIHCMQRDEKDPKILDLDPSLSLESQLPDTPDYKDENPPLKDDPKYAKYFKMIKMGMPREQVLHAIKRDENDPIILDLDPNKSLKVQLPPPLKEDPEYAKYFKMLKMGMPKEQVLHAMTRDEKDHKILDLDPNKSLKSQENQMKQAEDDGPPLKDDPEYAKYFKMLKMGMPKEQVLHAMTRDEKDHKILDFDPNKSLKSQENQTKEAEDDGPPLKDDPEYSKYFKMEKMGLPKGAVKNALVRDGKDPSIIDLDPNKSLKAQLGGNSIEEKDVGTPLKDDPEYAKYFKMEKMGLPRDAVKNALLRDGKDPGIIDLDPSMSLEYQRKKSKSISAAEKTIVKKKKKKVRRKKIYWNPIDPSKLKKDSLWSIVRNHVEMGSLDYDQKEFEELFTESAESNVKKKKTAPAEKKEKKLVQSIDPKRSMNGGIVLSRIKTDHKKIAEYVNSMEHNKFDATQLKNLREYLATADERRGLTAYMSKGANSEEKKKELYKSLSETEKYMVTLMEVPDAEAKLHTMEFRNGFKTRFADMTASVRILNRACEQLRSSEKFRKLMAVILTVVNQINTGGEGNLAMGFTLDALLKLNEAKAFDKKTSVLHYVVKLVKKNDESLLCFETDLTCVIPAESVLLDTVIGDLKGLQAEVVDIKKIVSKEAEALEKAGKIPKPTLADLMEQKSIVQYVGGVAQFNKITHLTGRTSMERFTMNAQVACEQAMESVESVKAKYLLVLGYFGEDETMATGDFFGTLRRFMLEWKKAIVQVEKIERLQAKEKKREARRAAKAAKSKSKKAKGSSLKRSQKQEPTNSFAKPTVGGLAALAAEAALKKTKQAPPPGGIAALAAEAALKKSKQAPPAGGIAALAAEAALKKSKQAPPGGGIAALAAEAALKKSKQAPPGGGIAALAAEAALKKSKQAPPGGGIAALAAEAALKKSKQAPPGGGIAALAAEAALKKSKQAPPGGGIAALAAEAALKKMQTTPPAGEAALKKTKKTKEGPPGDEVSALEKSNDAKKEIYVDGTTSLAVESISEKINETNEKPPEDGTSTFDVEAVSEKSEEAKEKPLADAISAPPTEAAMERTKESNKTPPVGGIATLAAEAVSEKSEEAKGTPLVDAISAPPTEAAMERTKESNKKPPVGGIATLAAEAALKISRKNKELDCSNDAVGPEPAVKSSKEETPAIALEITEETSPANDIPVISIDVTEESSEKLVSGDITSKASPNIGIAAQATEGSADASGAAHLPRPTPQEMRSEILRQNHDDSSVAVMAEDLEKEAMDSSDTKNWDEGEGISDYMGWANQAIKASDTESVRGFEATQSIVDHCDYDDESTIATNFDDGTIATNFDDGTIATNFDDDASIATAMTSAHNHPQEGNEFYDAEEQHDDYAGDMNDPYNPMATDAMQSPYQGDAVINMPLDFHQDEGLDLGLSFGGEEGFDGPGEYGSNELMQQSGFGDGVYDNSGLGGFGDAGLGGFGLASPTLKRDLQNDYSAHPAGHAENDLSWPWGASASPDQNASKPGGDQLARPWGASSMAKPKEETPPKKKKKWFW